MRLKDAKAAVRAVGLMLVRRDYGDEYMVKEPGNPPGWIDRAYFTSDLDDAVDTARLMAKRRNIVRL